MGVGSSEGARSSNGSCEGERLSNGSCEGEELSDDSSEGDDSEEVGGGLEGRKYGSNLKYTVGWAVGAVRTCDVGEDIWQVVRMDRERRRRSVYGIRICMLQ